MKPLAQRHLLLGGILLIGAVLRFWHLDSKPVWSDEVLTAIFSLGRNFYEVTQGQAFPLTALDYLFALNPAATCGQIGQTVAVQSVHPPLFFCWMHHWLRWTDALPLSWVWKVRALPALFGVVAIAALYQFNRVAFSVKAGLMGAALMAVSPFAVYLSQEARHYTVPIVLVILALLGLYQMHIDLYEQRFRPLNWCGWVLVNSVGFYVHYFFILAFIAQGITLVANFLSMKYVPTLHPKAHLLNPMRSLAAIALAMLGVCLLCAPWFPTLLSHLSRPETDWLAPTDPDWVDWLSPLYRIPVGWILMVIALPVEKQPLWVVVSSVGVMVVFTGWLLWQLTGRLANLWSTAEAHLATRMLVLFILTVLLEFLATVYLLGKDLTLVPRYNFIYFPAVMALLGASLVQEPVEGKRRRRSIPPNGRVAQIVLLVSLLSSICVVTNLSFQKPYQPNWVAREMAIEPKPLLVSMAANDFQDVALGLSFALALQQPVSTVSEDATPAAPTDRYFAFLSRSPDYGKVFQTLTTLKHSLPSPFNFWLIAPGIRQVDFPASLAITDQAGTPQKCLIERSRYHRRGVPYQMYRCGNK